MRFALPPRSLMLGTLLLVHLLEPATLAKSIGARVVAVVVGILAGPHRLLAIAGSKQFVPILDEALVAAMALAGIVVFGVDATNSEPTGFHDS